MYWWSDNYLYGVAASTGEQLMFGYGPDRRRWGQIYWDADGNEEATFYAGPVEMVSDYDNARTLTSVTSRDYIYAGSEPVAIYSLASGGNTLNYLLTDQQRSISAIVNSSGQTVVNESFTAFGDRRNPSTWSGPASGSDLAASEAITRQGYTFQTLLGEDLGFNHMNGRVQDAIIGRFLSADPKIPDPTDPQDYNRYSYTRNNPLTFDDPTGFDASSAFACQQTSLGLLCLPPPACFGIDSSLCDYAQGLSANSAPQIGDDSLIQSASNAAFDDFLAQSGSTPSLNLSVDDPLSSLDNPLSQSQSSNSWLENLSETSDLLDATLGPLSEADPLTLGQALSGYLVTSSQQFQNIGTAWEPYLQFGANLAKYSGYTLSSASIIYSGYQGYESAGLAGALTEAVTATDNAAISYAIIGVMSMAGPLGSWAGVGVATLFNALGGIQGLESLENNSPSLNEARAINSQLEQLGYPIPLLPY